MTLSQTQGSARAWGGVCSGLAERAVIAGKTIRLVPAFQSALPGGGAGAARQAGRGVFVGCVVPTHRSRVWPTVRGDHAPYGEYYA